MSELLTVTEPRATKRIYLIEIALFFGLALAVDVFWGSGSRFMLVEPHPFWVIVLLMAVQYGTTEALVATVVATSVLFFGEMPAQAFDQDAYEYALEILRRALLWMLASVVLGELRARHRLQHTEATTRLRNVERQVALLTQSHADLSTAKERLEIRLAGQLKTAAGVLEAARPLETLDPGKVLGGASELLHAALHANAFSLFLLKGDALVLVAAEGQGQESAFAQRYPSTTLLFQEVVGAQRYVSVATEDGERVLQGQGLIAGPLIDPTTGTLFGMLKVDQMRFLDFNLSSVQTFKALCEWIAAAYGNAVAHQSSQVEDQATHLVGMKHLDREVDYLAEVALRMGFDLTLLSFQVVVTDLPETARRELPAVLGEVSRQVLRRTDLVFSHQPPSTEFAVLLPGATAESALVVSKKLVSGLREACGYDVPCASQVRAICVADEGPSRRGRRADLGSSHQVA